MTEERLTRNGIIEEICQEFDFIIFCQSIMVTYGFEAKKKLDHFIALSMRKLLFDRDYPLLLIVCPEFKMPPLTGELFNCPGENKEMKLHTICTNLHVKKQNEWIPFDEWKNQTISWIAKGVQDVPTIIEDNFFEKLLKGTNNNRVIGNSYEHCYVKDGENMTEAWMMKDPENTQEKVYEVLKEAGYYDLTIQRMIKHIADKKAAHTDIGNSIWISLENTSADYRHSAISAFSTQMIYAATKQIKELNDYWQVEPLLEIL